MTISARIICDTATGTKRLTTFLLTYPRMIHSEIMTHRALSRNASSSRAIPVNKIIQQVLDDPALPVWWGKNQAGMQAQEELDDTSRCTANNIWLDARDNAVEHARQLVKLGLHKQIANRILEPWHHITVVASATEWANFFTLRCHPDAQPEFRVLAERMSVAYRESIPDEDWQGWHLPFISIEERDTVNDIMTLVKCSVARCARTSYLNHDQTSPSIEKDIDLHNKLVLQRPAHASPAEHPALVRDSLRYTDSRYDSNFIGFVQYRKLIPDLYDVEENSRTFPWEKEKALD